MAAALIRLLQQAASVYEASTYIMSMVVLYIENNRGGWCVLGHVEGGGKHRLVIAYTATHWSGTKSIIHRGASHGNGKRITHTRRIK